MIVFASGEISLLSKLRPERVSETKFRPLRMAVASLRRRNIILLAQRRVFGRQAITHDSTSHTGNDGKEDDHL